jgi:L-ascorbate metabolism protein UlaG (beta-lactamase superfamily)
MRIQWYGHSAFWISGAQTSIFIDPFGDMSPMAGRGVQFEYPVIEGVEADLVLVTHEHLDHNGVEAIGGDPTVLRSTAGRHESPIGEILAVASEHDQAAGTERGPNTIFVFELDGVRVAHFGDFGQRRLREEQAQAIGSVDLVFVPVGGGPTVDAAQARQIVDEVGAKWVVPMHYRTPKIGFLDSADAFLERFTDVHRLAEPSFELDQLPAAKSPLAVVPVTP